ncbi:hypothetical protein CRE_29109 [Caenorhabditis remanei]|uniref:Uncharacterized protein n=1 Tax=Caenorhabditis remanei TaxID=31234 RepID=E3N4K1_CAERE|nr:hypothetical protein CRE_29109 [Caenorhabditis remanei]
MNFIHLLAVITIIPLCMSWSSFFPTQSGQPGDLEYGKGNTEFLGNFTCSLNKVWCIHVEYVELDLTCSNYKYSLDLVELGTQREEILYYHAGDYQKVVREWIMQHVTKVPLPGLENAVRPPWNSLPTKFPTSLCLGEMDDEIPYTETLQYYEALYFNSTTVDTTTPLNSSSSTILSPEMSSSSDESSIDVSNSTMT